MPDLPVILKMRGRRCVIVGGGSVALRRARGLLQVGASVCVIAPEVEAELAALPVEFRGRPYQAGDLAGAFLVIVATDDLRTNQAVAEEARATGVLVNRTDDPQAGDLVIPAHEHRGPLTVAVHTSGISAAAAAVIRDQCLAAIDPDWPRLLEAVAPYRKRIQQQVVDPVQRREKLLQLTDPQALRVLKAHGSDGLCRYCDDLVHKSTAQDQGISS